VEDGDEERRATGVSIFVYKRPVRRPTLFTSLSDISVEPYSWVGNAVRLKDNAGLQLDRMFQGANLHVNVLLREFQSSDIRK
jgi:hypothetical protein